MWMWGRIRVQYGERVVLYRDGRPTELLLPGRYVRFGRFGSLQQERFSLEDPWIRSERLRDLVNSGVLGAEARVLDLDDRERAIVKIDGRYVAVCGAGLVALWKAERKIEVERFEVQAPSLQLLHPALPLIVELPGARQQLEVAVVGPSAVGLVTRDGKPAGEIGSGLQAFWKGAGKIQVLTVDTREQVLDVSGQEILTADKVTLRLNALVTYRVIDAWKAVTTVEAYAQALYRQAQLALRAVVGTRELDVFLAEKDGVVEELERTVKARAAEFGLEVLSLGIRDVILPGEMKEILNRVVEARKQAEAALLTRREETAAMRMQANTARIFESNPLLLKLRELEVLEKVAEKAKLSVFLGSGEGVGLAERVMKLI
jgi:regulator of protease activity HflC (stomatin/prohibitin superfamily)